MKKNAGFSLLEVLVSLLIISFTLINLNQLKLLIWSDLQGAYYSYIGMNQIASLYERMKLTQESGLLTIWNAENQQYLPRGKGSIKSIDQHAHIELAWGKKNNTNCDNLKLGITGCIKIETIM